MASQFNHNRTNTSLLKRIEEYLGELVYGGMDGCVTTFAVVAGAVGANLNSNIIIILGFANLFADGLSMSIGAYLSAKSEKERFKKYREIESWEIENLRESELQEIREIFGEKGFEGDLLEKIVEVISQDKDRWIDVMMKEELGMMEEKKSPFWIGFATLLSFMAFGFIPLTIYVWDFFYSFSAEPFFWTSILTGIGFIIIGFLKSYVAHMNLLKGVFETLALGLVAATVAYYVGDFIEQLLQ